MWVSNFIPTTGLFKVSDVGLVSIFKADDPPINLQMAKICTNYGRPRKMICLYVLAPFLRGHHEVNHLLVQLTVLQHKLGR